MQLVLCLTPECTRPVQVLVQRLVCLVARLELLLQGQQCLPGVLVLSHHVADIRAELHILQRLGHSVPREQHATHDPSAVGRRVGGAVRLDGLLTCDVLNHLLEANRVDVHRAKQPVDLGVGQAVRPQRVAIEGELALAAGGRAIVAVRAQQLLEPLLRDVRLGGSAPLLLHPILSLFLLRPLRLLRRLLRRLLAPEEVRQLVGQLVR